MYSIIRRLDNLGRITLPIDFRRHLSLMERARVEIEITDEGILIKPLKKEGGK